MSRANSAALDQVLGQDFRVLDKGFVRVVDYMGNDEAIVQAARVSYGKGTKSLSSDEGLIRYLLRHWHTTPFEMCEIKFHIKVPVFVARQWIRHRTANVNEISARYSILDSEFYLPAPEHLSAQSVENKQGRGSVLSGDEAKEVQAHLSEMSQEAYRDYVWLLAEEEPQRQGLARELARMRLPVNIYTQFYWKIDLHNLMHFLRLRIDPHAQYEIRAYAEQMFQIMQLWCPVASKAFEDYRQNAASFSGPMLDLLRRIIAGESISQEQSGLSQREWNEFQQLIKAQ